MGCLSSKPNTVPSVPTEQAQPSQPQPRPREPTSIPRVITSTPSPRHDTVGSARACAPSQGAVLSQRPHDDGRDYPPPSSGGDLLTSQYPDRQEMPSRPHPSGSTSRMQRTRSVPMDVSAPPSSSAPSRMSRQKNCSASLTAGRQGDRSRFPFALQSLLPNDFRYAVGPCHISP